MVIELRVHKKIREIPETDWDRLDGVRDAPFLSWAFLDALEQTGCVGHDTGWIPYHLSFWEGERLVAASPTYLKDNSEGEFVFDHAWASAAHRARLRYYPKLIVAAPFTPATAPRLLVAAPSERSRLIPALAEALRMIADKGELSSAHVLFPTETEAGELEEAGLLHRVGIQFHWQNDVRERVSILLHRLGQSNPEEARGVFFEQFVLSCLRPFYASHPKRTS